MSDDLLHEFKSQLSALVIRREPASPDELMHLLELFKGLGGKTIYIPRMSADDKAARNAAMRQERLEGATYLILARRYRLKTRQVRRIVDHSEAA